MKNKLLLILFCLLTISNFIFADSKIKFLNSMPASGTHIASIQKIILNFDLTNVYSTYPNVNKDEWGIVSGMIGTRKARLYKGTEAINDAKIDSIVKKVSYSQITPGNSLELEFNKEIKLEANEIYTLIIDANIFNAAIKSRNYSDTRLTTLINLTFYGAEATVTTLKSAMPSTDNPIEELQTLSLTFEYGNNEMQLSSEAPQASLYEKGSTEPIKSAGIVFNEGSKTFDIDFGGEGLYNSHSYEVVIPANSVYPVDPDTQSPLTDKGNKEITLTYNGAKYYELTHGRITPSPGGTKKVSYFSSINIPFVFPTGYNLGRNSKVSGKLYEGTPAEGTLAGTYEMESSSNVTTVVFPIWKFDLKPNSTYTFVVAKGQIVPMSSEGNVTLKDTTNPEIVLEYKTPAELEPLDKIGFSATLPADKAEIEKLEEVSFVFNPYEFESTKYNPVIANAEAKAILMEVTGETEKELQQIPLTISGNQEEGYSAKGTVGRTLYEGKTYKLRVPAGYFRPSEARLPDYTANDEYVLTLKGKASRYGLAGKSGIVANENLPGVGVAAFYFEGEVTPVPEAKASIYKGDNETPEKETPIFTANGTVFADFSDDTRAPYALQAGAAYRLVLPKGSVASQADAEMMNGEVSVAFGGPAVTEYVTVSYVTDNAATQTKVAKGNTATYTFTLEPKWEVKSLLFNDAEAKESIAAGVYTTPALNADATLKVTLNYTGSTYTEGPGTGVIAPEGTSLKAYSSDGNVVIEGLTADTDVVTVYSMGGAVLQHFTATNVAATITLPANTYYLVKVNDVMMKILNK